MQLLRLLFLRLWLVPRLVVSSSSHARGFHLACYIPGWWAALRGGCLGAHAHGVSDVHLQLASTRWSAGRDEAGIVYWRQPFGLLIDPVQDWETSHSQFALFRRSQTLFYLRILLKYTRRQDSCSNCCFVYALQVVMKTRCWMIWQTTIRLLCHLLKLKIILGWNRYIVLLDSLTIWNYLSVFLTIGNK